MAFPGFGAGATNTSSTPFALGGGSAPAAQNAPKPFAGFGSTINTTTAPGTGSSLFTTAGTTQQPASTIFGGAAVAPQAGITGTGATSIFAAGQQQLQAQVAANNISKPTVTSHLYASGAGQNLLGDLRQLVPGQPIIGGVEIDATTIRPTTRFSDLKPEIQKQIIKIQEFITTQISIATACAAATQTSESGNDSARLPIDLDLLPVDVEMMVTKLKTVSDTIQRDTFTIVSLKGLVKAAETDLESVSHAIESVKLPSAMKMNGLWNHYFGASRTTRPDLGASASRMSGPVAEALEERKTGSSIDIVTLFQNRAQALESELEIIKKHIGTIEGHIRLVENRAAMEAERLARSQHGAFNGPASLGSSMGGDDGIPQISPRMQEMMETMRLFESAIIRVAGRIGELRERFVELSTGNLPPM